MRQTVPLLQQRTTTTLITLFTRANCPLCDNAKFVIEKLIKKKNLDYRQVDVMASDQQRWRNLYEFDVPVLYVQRFSPNPSEIKSAIDTRKLMHRFDERQVEALIDEAQKGP